MSTADSSFHSVVAIDDHPIVLESIHALLAGSPHLRLVATAADGAEGLQLIRSARPKLAIVDINLPSLDGLELVRRVRAQRHDIGLVVTSADTTGHEARLAFLAGANAYVPKSEATSVLTAALQLAARGYLSFPRSAIGASEGSGLDTLTKREMRVNQLLAEGYRNTEIARRLGISPKTVSTFKHRISRKIGLPE
ncbi:response regulator transcription factor [Ralstonia mannitolilytica]|uniref:Positive transcription regulator evgA n=1 Tax=Ralstonia mannitolilytica TaxID=105219 RepID=A0AAJ4ZN50_9RALS|nr:MULTISPECIES: response regulator transcription factor [Ralstonia]MBU9580629.1 response regulator transcription factor [Ralstonia mannitolilytica]PLT20423.1 DNA-binding response regulator [Ralstonia mannitolilytica]CAG2149671.1 DNA-binding transcriptional activator EvgA [Ralstonia mannitolilytica]CAJ0736624.1 DNA-binding transcriptional activator EvgA [Ralstonia mannitolilytica]SUD89182.1 Positive transcription regulator evgA [Ralstonia mannitolilytica]